MKTFNRGISLTLIILMLFMVFLPAVSMAAEPTVTLGTTENFAVLAGSTITNTGTTTINGDVGLHPGTVFTGQASTTVTGDVYLTDAVALQAKADLVIAYDDADGRTPVTIPAELGGETLTPGVYNSVDGSLGITGMLTLDAENDPNAVFVFQTTSTVVTASGSNVKLINGAQSCNVFWQVGSSATLGTNSQFTGIIMAMESITANSGATVNGQLLAQTGAVTLDTNIINSECVTPPDLGSLEVTKVVQGPVGGLTLPVFEMTVTGPGGFSETRNFLQNESFTWTNLVPGAYTVTENPTGLSSRWSVSGEGTVQVIANETAETTIINSYSPSDDSNNPPFAPTGSLTVDKVVAGNISDLTMPVFEMTVTGPGGFSETRNFLQNESFTWTNLVPGTYTVTENRTGLNSQWAVSGEGTVQVTANRTAETTITNSYSPPVTPTGSLTVDKIVAGNISDLTMPLFKISVTGPAGFSATRTFVQNESFTWTNLVPGEYTVTENRTGLSSQWAVSGEGIVQVTANETAETTITNLYSPPVAPTGSLTVDKVVTGNIDGLTMPLFRISVTGPEGFSATRTFVQNESYTWTNLVPGAYTITESRTGLSSSQWAVSGEGTVQVTADEMAVTTITNHYEKVLIPQTGQNTDYSMAIFLGITAVLFAGIGATLQIRKRKLNG